MRLSQTGVGKETERESGKMYESCFMHASYSFDNIQCKGSSFFTFLCIIRNLVIHPFLSVCVRSR